MKEKEYLQRLQEIENLSNKVRREVNVGFRKLITCCKQVGNTNPIYLDVKGNSIQFTGEDLVVFNVYNPNQVDIIKKSNYLMRVPANPKLDTLYFLPFKNSQGFQQFRKNCLRGLKDLDRMRIELVRELLSSVRGIVTYKQFSITTSKVNLNGKELSYLKFYNKVRISKELRSLLLE